MALHHAAAGEVVDLMSATGDLEQRLTHALAKTPHFETIRLIIRAGAVIPEHKVAGPITLHCLTGAMVVVTSADRITLRSGEWTHLAPGEPHSVEGIEDSTALLTIIFDKGDG